MSVISRINIGIQSSSEISPDVYQLAIRGVNVILIVEQKLTLIDTGYSGSAPQIIDFIRHLGRKPEEISLIILTHNNIDHIGGLVELKQLTSARVAVHKADIGKRGNRPYVKTESADIQVEGGEVLKPLGGLEVVHTPGHTQGCISLFSPRNKLLIVGDALRRRNKNLHLPLKLPYSDMNQAIESIKKLARLDFNVLCFGHGLPLVDDAQVKIRDLIERNKY
ncbi:MBL fold metallo-hydrolase [Chloroflexota bacterium]